MIRKVVSGRKFTWFLVCLALVYLVVWLQVFQRQENHYDVNDEDGEGEGHICNCDKLVRFKVDRHGNKIKPVTVQLMSDHHKDDVREEQVARSNRNSSLPDTMATTIARYNRFSCRQFKPGQTKLVLVLGYQRVGSSFFGQIFDLNPDIFYVYEPLDALYQAMYGTGAGYNIPSDITSYKNGSDRTLPREEIGAVTKFLVSLLTCNMKQLPDEFFVHSFWSFLPMFMPSWTPYLECLQTRNLTNSRSKCSGKLKCPKRFGLQPWHSDNCKRHLWNNVVRGRLSADGAGDVGKPLVYKSCMTGVRKSAGQCVQMMDKKCKGTRFRVAKTVRATMESVEDLISDNPNVRIIHLFRDPRPVAVSRMTTETYRGIYSRNSTVREAGLYCSILTRDLRLRRHLQDKYPGTFYEVLYDDFVKYPGQYATSVYSFLDITIPETLVPWVNNKTRGADKTIKPGQAQKLNKKVPKWKRKLTVDESEQIMSVCREFYDMIDYDFT